MKMEVLHGMDVIAAGMKAGMDEKIVVGSWKAANRSRTDLLVRLLIHRRRRPSVLHPEGAGRSYPFAAHCSSTTCLRMVVAGLLMYRYYTWYGMRRR